MGTVEGSTASEFSARRFTMEYTDLEKKVFNAALDICIDDYSADVNEIAEVTGLQAAVVKGVVGSLVKKKKLYVVSEKRGGVLFNDIHIFHSEWSGSYGCDCLSEEDIEDLKL